ncbi:MAG: TIGR03000 domain-containing protein [Zavarzinella sp.]
MSSSYYAPAYGETPVASVPGNKARLVVNVPADAKLYANDQLTELSGTTRSFLTPELPGNGQFSYNLRVEYMANGERQTENRKVFVSAGQTTSADFTKTLTANVSSPVVVTLPENANLMVDGVRTNAKGPVAEFRTPELNRGQSYTYVFTAVINSNGTEEVVDKKVTFTAGEPIRVNFGDILPVRTASLSK